MRKYIAIIWKVKYCLKLAVLYNEILGRLGRHNQNYSYVNCYKPVG